MSLAPFDAPLCAPACPAAWRAERDAPPTWQLWGEGLCMDAFGFRALLGAAGLPEQELLHMGCWPCWLWPHPGSDFVARAPAELLLGRIVWDRRFGDAGEPWSGLLADRAFAKAAGEVATRKWFVCR